jgi:ABC-type protease/lipase transport system fused ATPase/permease subunit
MPEGYDTQIGEGGMTLSGGERQRVALARALYGAPRFVVLDEPNASLDSEGEQSLIQALITLKSEKVTTVVIAHRPAVLQHVDKVLIIKDGVIQAFGARDDVFSKLSSNHPGSGTPPPYSSSASVPTGIMRYE